MARLEIPSIVVHAGSCSCPASPQMERSSRTQRSLSNQEQFESQEGEEGEVTWEKGGSGGGTDDGFIVPPSDSPQPVTPTRIQQTGEPPPASITEVPPITSLSSLRPKSQNSKVKLLVRSHAMREETSPPPDPDRAALEPTVLPPSSLATPPVTGRPSSRLRLKHQGSSQGSFDSSSPCSLSRDSSTEQPPTGDSSGVDLQVFLAETVNRSQKDRQLLLRIEQDLLALTRDTKRTQLKFPPMSSYQRMLVHRMAALFVMEHNVDPTGSQVIVALTPATKVPELRLRDHLRGDLPVGGEEPRRSILKRDSSSLEDAGFKSPERQMSSESRRSKSFEEREEEYEKARKRIFNKDGGEMLVRVRGESGGADDSSRLSSQEELRTWGAGGGHVWSSSDSSEHSSRPQLLRPSPPNPATLRPGRLLKVESFESRDHLRANSMRQAVSKSYSFGGYSGGAATGGGPGPNLARGDSVSSTHSAGARLLTKQDSGASSIGSRLSPLSSGYKSLGSQRSDATLSATPSPTATPMLPQAPASSVQAPCVQAPALMWAVTNMSSVPPGSVLINPQTGQPYLNSDSTLYHYDPSNPPRIVHAPPETAQPPAAPPHSVPQPPSIQVHPSYPLGPAPEYVYHNAPPQQTQTIMYSVPQGQPIHPQQGQQSDACMGAVSELANYFVGLQLNPNQAMIEPSVTSAVGTSTGQPQPQGTNYVLAPWSSTPQQSVPRPSIPPSSVQTGAGPQQMPPTVYLVPQGGSPQRPMALYSHYQPAPPSATGISETYYTAGNQLMQPTPPSAGVPMFQQQHAMSPSTVLHRPPPPPPPGGDNSAYPVAGTTPYYPSTPAGMPPTASYCYNTGQAALNLAPALAPPPVVLLRVPPVTSPPAMSASPAAAATTLGAMPSHLQTATPSHPGTSLTFAHPASPSPSPTSPVLNIFPTPHHLSGLHGGNMQVSWVTPQSSGKSSNPLYPNMTECSRSTWSCYPLQIPSAFSSHAHGKRGRGGTTDLSARSLLISGLPPVLGLTRATAEMALGPLLSQLGSVGLQVKKAGTGEGYWVPLASLAPDAPLPPHATLRLLFPSQGAAMAAASACASSECSLRLSLPTSS